MIYMNLIGMMKPTVLIRTLTILILSFKPNHDDSDDGHGDKNDDDHDGDEPSPPISSNPIGMMMKLILTQIN
eukprot:CAMPEP_0119037180 /NCGR_PEP_ID=MMETSP1177-20130426/5372_1 /TAXON_ID=2985 /ORGANISM="Ochromonas sp, Strain CCMP1899" /LENGTH=71 /DNA_ID=CAMNT_0006998075 /DNA_START=60 /DNA_END=272 /DNA_ORIENTATION=+